MAKLHGPIDLNPNLKEFRERNGLSIRKSAEFAGFATPSAWKHYEDGRRGLPLDRWMLLLSNMIKDQTEDECRRIFWSMFNLHAGSLQGILDVANVIIDAYAHGLDENDRINYEIRSGEDVSPEEWQELKKEWEKKKDSSKPGLTRTVTLTIDENLEITNVDHGYVQ